MGIYRGPGGTGDAVSDASSQAAITVIARDEAVAANNAAQLAAAAAQLAEDGAQAAEAGAIAAQNSTQGIADGLQDQIDAAFAAAGSASTSATAAATSASNAATSETNAAAYELSAQEWATKTSGPVAGGEYSSKYNAQLAATSATSAGSSATSASTSASSASTSATNAASSASSASTSATNAANSATSASGSATSASSSASSASTSATNAASSATSAASSASTATTQAGLASSSATSAASSASSASTSASNAATSATNAASSATAASAAQTAAETARDQTLTAYDNFDDRYLGAKASNPTVDNDGNALVAGALYFNSTDGAMRVYTGSVWVDAYAAGTSFLAKANNLSDLTNVATARTNLGLGTAATTDSTAYATAAQALTAGGTAGQILAKNSSTNYDAAWIDNYATQVKFQAKNTSGSTITKGSVVYVSGGAGANPYIAKAQANSEAASATTVGFLETDVANNGFGLVVVKGVITGIDTSAAADGDPVWLSPTTAGGMAFGLANKPSAPNHLVYLGTVTRASATQGEVQIQISNGWEIEELHNVSVTSPSDGQLLTWEASTSLWKNKAAPISLPSQTGQSGKYLTTDGTTASWGSITAGASLSNDTSTSSNLYPLFAAATSGTPTTIYTSNSKYLYKPSTGELQSPAVAATNGLLLTAATNTTSYSIPSGQNAVTVGPFSVAAGTTITVPANSRLVVL